MHAASSSSSCLSSSAPASGATSQSPFTGAVTGDRLLLLLLLVFSSLHHRGRILVADVVTALIRDCRAITLAARSSQFLEVAVTAADGKVRDAARRPHIIVQRVGAATVIGARRLCWRAVRRRASLLSAVIYNLGNGVTGHGVHHVVLPGRRRNDSGDRRGVVTRRWPAVVLLLDR